MNLYILVAKKSSVIAIRNGRICELDLKMNPIKIGDKIFSFFFGRFQILARLFRKIVYTIKKIDNEKYVLSCGSGFFFINTTDLSVLRIKTPKDFKKCLNVGLVEIKGIKNIIYSNYNSNLKKNKVNIYIAPVDSLNDYKLIHTFKKNEINHIHSFYQDPLSKDIFFNVGDYCKYVGIWKLQHISLEAKPCLIGSQDYRAVFCWFHKGDFIFTSDYPGGKNKINKINILESDKRLTKINDLKGPVIYGTETKNYVYFATSAEPKKNLGMTAYFPILPIFQKSYLYQFNKNNSDLKLISYAKKDWLNPYLFGFGSFQFPHTEINAKLYVNKVGLKKTISKLKFTSSHSHDVYEL